jgi:hypothetical protein
MTGHHAELDTPTQICLALEQLTLLSEGDPAITTTSRREQCL